MITVVIEKENFQDMVEQLKDMLDRLRADEVEQALNKYRLTITKMRELMEEYDAEIKPGATYILYKFHQVDKLSELPLDEWTAYYERLAKNLELKRQNDQFEDLLKDLAW